MKRPCTTESSSPTAPEDTARASLPHARAWAVALAAALCVGASAAPAAAVAPQEVSRGVEIPEFYDPPSELPDENGALVRTEPLPLGISFPGLDGKPLPGEATRLMYKSTDAGGGPVGVTGAYIEPSKAWKGEGPRPLIAVASGTMGQGDQCAPSLALQHPLTIGKGTISVGYEDLAIYRLLSAGIAVVVTDYPGLGATDRLHTYVNRLDEGHAVLDAVRAARHLEGTSLTPESRIGLYGYSQGGGATAAASELQPDYAPDIELAGTYSGAPPADLTEVMQGIDGSSLAGALGWSINGFVQTEPELGEIVDAHINDDGAEALEDLSTMCIGDALFGYGFSKSSSWTKDGSSLSDIVADEPKLQSFLDEQLIGKSKPAGPVRLATGVKDDIVPHGQARTLAESWCAKDADVEYVPVPGPNIGDKLGGNHILPLLTDQGSAISWLKDRVSGKPSESNCGTLPDQ
ncbi:lipase family protein [Streptomyces xiaopingdaonensis]|uniref:lipase family protein n=1 Tax=Streptomyces xiaopingdaonensis TaxID=1565415 RepID=UPI0003681781